MLKYLICVSLYLDHCATTPVQGTLLEQRQVADFLQTKKN